MFGVVIAWIATFRGFGTTGGALGVGRATSRTVVETAVLILCGDYVMTALLSLMTAAPLVRLHENRDRRRASSWSWDWRRSATSRSRLAGCAPPARHLPRRGPLLERRRPQAARAGEGGGRHRSDAWSRSGWPTTTARSSWRSIARSSCRRTRSPRSRPPGCWARRTSRSRPGAAEANLADGERITHTEPALNVADLLGRYAFGTRRGDDRPARRRRRSASRDGAAAPGDPSRYAARPSRLSCALATAAAAARARWTGGRPSGPRWRRIRRSPPRAPRRPSCGRSAARSTRPAGRSSRWTRAWAFAARPRWSPEPPGSRSEQQYKDVTCRSVGRLRRQSQRHPAAVHLRQDRQRGRRPPRTGCARARPRRACSGPTSRSRWRRSTRACCRARRRPLLRRDDPLAGEHAGADAGQAGKEGRHANERDVLRLQAAMGLADLGSTRRGRARPRRAPG